MTLHSAFFVATLSCCFSTAHVVASMFVRDGFRPLGCSLVLSFNELNISAMIALRFWYVVIDSFIQGAPNGASCYCIPTVGWCISLYKVLVHRKKELFNGYENQYGFGRGSERLHHQTWSHESQEPRGDDRGLRRRPATSR